MVDYGDVTRHGEQLYDYNRITAGVVITPLNPRRY